MAKAGAKTGIRGPGISHGICLAVFPARDPDPHVEIHRTTAANGSTAGGVGYDVIGVVDVQSGQRAFQYRDPLPPSNTTFFYRARNIRPEYTASTWTPVVGGMATNLPPGDLPYPQARVFTDTTAVQGPYQRGANSSFRETLLALGAAGYNFGNMYTNSTVAITASTAIQKRQVVTAAFDGQYDITVQGSYSSFSQVGADECILNVATNITTALVDTYSAASILKTFSWAPWGQLSSQGTFVVRTNQWLAAGTRVSLWARRTFVTSTGTNIEFKDDVSLEMNVKW